MDPTLDAVLTFGPVPLTLWIAMRATGAAKRALGPLAERPWAKRALPLAPVVVGGLLGLVPGFLPPADGVPPVVVGMIVGGWGPLGHGVGKRRTGARA